MRIWSRHWTRKARTAWSLPWSTRLMLVEALALLVVARVAVLLVPFRRIAPVLGRPNTETEPESDTAVEGIVRRVAIAIRLIAPHTPSRSNCLAQGIAGKLMLRRRGVESTLYLGVEKQGEELHAHAWLRAGRVVLTGGGTQDRFVRVASFGAVGGTIDSAAPNT